MKINNPIDQKVGDSIKCIDQMGLEVLDKKPNYVKIHAPFKGNENHFGTMYAGVQFILSDISAGGLFFMSFDFTKYFPLLKEMNIQYKKMVLSDVTLEISMSKDEAERISKEADENGKADFKLTSKLKDEEGDIVAVTKGLFQIRTFKKP